MSANGRQVGGTHYKKSEFQAWDWERYGVGGLEWTAIKYITRFRDKGGKEDLEKAIHYIEKLIEEAHQYGRCNRVTYPWYDMDMLIAKYISDWELNKDQAAAVKLLLYWTQTRALDVAIQHVQDLISDAYPTSDVQPSEHVESSATE